MENINQEILEKVIKLLESQPSIYESLNTTELEKGIDLVDIYSVCDDIDQNIYEEPGEIHFNMEIEQDEPIEEVKENNVPQQEKKKITLDIIRTYDKCDQFYRNIAETQGELEVFLDRNQDIYRNLLIQYDTLNYGELYSKDPKYIEKVKIALILLSEWLIAICHKFKIKKRILIQTQSVPRIQYKSNIILEYWLEGKKSADGRKQLEPKKQTIHEVLIAATPDMAYVLSEGFVISKLTNQLVTNFQNGQIKVKDWLIQVRAMTNLNNTEFQELLKMSREYFAEQSSL